MSKSNAPKELLSNLSKQKSNIPEIRQIKKDATKELVSNLSKQKSIIPEIRQIKKEKEYGKQKRCESCLKEYSLFNGEHLCKRCFRSICTKCSPNT